MKNSESGSFSHRSTSENAVDQTGKTTDLRLDVLFKERFHGAVNIRGVRYQLLYTLLRAFDLYGEAASLTLEGIEDLDLKGFALGNTFIQVKSADRPWNWAKLKEPLSVFLEAARDDPSSRFQLVFSFQLRKDIATLANRISLSTAERTKIESKFRKLCRDIGVSEDEAEALLAALTISSAPEDGIRDQLRRAIAEHFDLGSAGLDVYLAALTAHALDWAKERRTITRVDLEQVRVTVGEALAREGTFQAYGRAIIGKVSWRDDSSLEDFYKGKGTRPGHVVANADVRRDTWLERIDQALRTSKVCILRASSGQGKSTLMYRYAFDRWPHDDTFVLLAAQTPEQVEQIRSYLRFRSELSLPTLLMIDNAGWATRLWPQVAETCAALGVRVLVTVRHEDWFRFGKENLFTYEVLEPTLELVEAREIYRAFRAAGQLHPSVKSPEWAYERVGEPHLLLEYTYLLTHGQMLVERLHDQLQQISAQGEDTAKLEVLRRTVLASTLGAPIEARKLFAELPLRDDPQQVAQSLTGEYLTLEGGMLTGLHWVRSDHLVRLLHQGYPDLTTTAETTLNVVPDNSISIFVSNVMSHPDIDSERLLDALVSRARTAPTATIVSFLEGVFEAGERMHFHHKRPVFDKAYRDFGTSGPFLLGISDGSPERIDLVGQLADILGAKGDNLRKLQAFAQEPVLVPRGLERCTMLLTRAADVIDLEFARRDLASLGRLLDWCAACDVRLPWWSEISGDLSNRSNALRLPLADLSSFTQGLYRFDAGVYEAWFSLHKDDLLGYLKLHTSCLTLEVENNELFIEFVVDESAVLDANEQAVSRLRSLRMALPFCDSYRSQGVYTLPFGLTPSYDATSKEITREHLPTSSDTWRNGRLVRLVEAAFLPDSFYLYQEALAQARRHALSFTRSFSSGLKNKLEGRRVNFISTVESGLELIRELKALPNPPAQTPEAVKDALKKVHQNWASDLQLSVSQIFEFSQTQERRIGTLAVHNFTDVLRHLPSTHLALDTLYGAAPDYFNMSELNRDELRVYVVLADLLQAWIVDPPNTQHKNILRYVREKRFLKERGKRRLLRVALEPLGQEFTHLTPELHIAHDGPLAYTFIVFSVQSPFNYDEELSQLFDALAGAAETADFFYLIPTYNNARLVEAGYLLSSSQIQVLKEAGRLDWEALVPQPPPDILSQAIPTIPLLSLPLWQSRLDIIAFVSRLSSLAQQLGLLISLDQENRFVRQLISQEEARLGKALIELKATALILRSRLTAFTVPALAESSYLELLRFFETFELIAEHRTPEQNLQALPTPEEGLRALETLIESTH
jgi:hypothetical protein